MPAAVTRRGRAARGSAERLPAPVALSWMAGLAGLAIALLRPRRLAVRGGSMLPTLRPGDHLLVLRLPGIRVGDVVVVEAPAPAGPAGAAGRFAAPLVVVKRLAEAGPQGLVVLGDNPGASTDSRSWGLLPRRALRGRVVYRYAPRERAGRVPAARRASVRLL